MEVKIKRRWKGFPVGDLPSDTISLIDWLPLCWSRRSGSGVFLGFLAPCFFPDESEGTDRL